MLKLSPFLGRDVLVSRALAEVSRETSAELEQLQLYPVLSLTDFKP